MKISVIVPVYNADKYLERCIHSILNQTYSAFEILLINDGAKDNSGSICEKFSQAHANIHYFYKDNEGLGLTRNFGIKHAKGDFLVFVDADDEITEDLLHNLSKSQSISNADLVIVGHTRINANSQFVSACPYKKEIYNGIDIKNILLPRLIGSSPSIKDSISVSACGALYNKKTIEENQIFFHSEREIISEDLIFNIDFLSHATIVEILDTCNYLYRLNENSLTTSYRKDRFEKIKVLYKKEIELLNEIDILDITKYRLMRQTFVYLRLCFHQELNKISNLSYCEAFRNIKSICSDDFVKDIIENYPIQELGLKQQMFIYLIKFRCKLLIYWFCAIGVIK